MTVLARNIALNMAVLSLLVFGISENASASLLTNGTFDTDLSGWTIGAGTTTGVTWDSGTAHLGRPGTPGVAIFEQSFNIPAGTSQLAIDFEYEWQADRPANVDTFEVELSYESTGGTVTQTLLNEGSDTGVFSPPAVSFNSLLSLINLSNAPNNGLIRFTLTEVNSPVGTRIELDNVAISAVPEASAITVWLLLSGVTVMRRRKALS